MPKPLRVCYDQLAALHHQPFPLYYCNLLPEENLLLQAVLGKFQQQVLNLSAQVRFS